MSTETNPSKTGDESQPEQFDVKAVNAQQPLYAARKRIHPKRAKGTFRSFKWLVMALTLGIYYITPWLRWDRGEFAPDQAVLIDMANRRFYFFFIDIWPQEFFFVAGLLVLAGIGLFLVTSTVGRAWCGYACPQTIWVDLFLVVERYFEGDRNDRIKLDAAPRSTSKMMKRTAKHVVWILIAISTGGAWIFYFADAPTLAVDFVTGQAAFVAYATVAVLAAFTYIFGGFMREQVCTYMCPWPRIQGAMLDEDSLTVTYNEWRGEPRSLHRKKLKKQGKVAGDCVDCNACVAVCPMGIDIRDGQQLECITCALCIDACDNVMDKLGLERGLISYTTLRDYNSNFSLALTTSSGESMPSNVVSESIVDPNLVRDGAGKLFSKFAHTDWRTIVRPRTIIYSCIYGAIGLALLVALMVRDRLDLNVLHDRNPTFVLLSDGSIRNGFKVKVLNMKTRPRQFTLKLQGLPGATMKVSGADKSVGRSMTFEVKQSQLLAIKLFVSADRKSLSSEQTDFKFVVTENRDGGEEVEYTAKFTAPK